MRVRATSTLAALATSTLLAAGLTGAAPSAVTAAPAPSPGVADCEPGSGARVEQGATAQEPPLYAPKDANKYGLIPDLPTLAPGSVTIDTVFHVLTDATPTKAERTRTEQMIDAQLDVLNAAYSGQTSDTAADTPFRFALTGTTWTVDPTWAQVTPGKTEKDMKAALHTGDSETLNVYAADIGGGLLGWAYFPKGYNNGRDYIDGVVILDESMPGGTVAPYNEGDTLTHEVGHWLMLEHTFAGACSASGDGVADTPREAYPQFTCDETADSCSTLGLDPVHNFMDYTEDFCMDEFTPGQAARMSDAWQAFRAGGNG
jgi:hypothetical protein